MTDKVSTIVKNTIFLYLRSIFVLFVALYTSRVFLNSLGIEDYGIYNAVGGVIGLFDFLQMSLAASTQRFFSVDIVRCTNNIEHRFKSSIALHIIIVIFIIIIAETVGLYFLNEYMDIPNARISAANQIYQTIVLSLAFILFSVPFTALIISHEKMNVIAIVSIVQAMLKLLLAFVITDVKADKLIFFGIVICVINIIGVLMYIIYCIKNFKEIKIGVLFDKVMIKNMFNYTSWTLLGHGGFIISKQAVNIYLNIFFSVVANASMAIANQVNAAFKTFTNSFQIAFKPQITKSYASNEYDFLLNIVVATSKMSYLLLFFLSLPILFNIDFVLKLWLGNVPQFASVFCIFVLHQNLLDVLSTPLSYVILSNKNIKKYQLTVMLVYFLGIVCMYFLYEMGFPSYTALLVQIISFAMVLFIRLYFAHKVANVIKVGYFLKTVILPLFLTSITIDAIYYFSLQFVSSLMMRMIISLIIISCSVIFVYKIVLNNIERNKIKSMIKRIVK